MTMLDLNTRLTPTTQAWSATAVTTDIYPLQVTGRDISIGEPMCLVFTVTTAGAVAGSETYDFQVQTATASNGTTGALQIATSGVFTVATGAILRGSLAVGKQVVVVIAPGSISPLATHLCGKVVIGASGTISALVDLMPLSAVATFKSLPSLPAIATGG